MGEADGNADEFGVESAGVGGFVLSSFATGTRLFFALVAWGVWHARRAFSRLEPAPTTAA